MLDILKRHKLFANLKKCRFHKDKVCFLSYIVLAQKVKIEDKQIKVVKNWSKPTLIKDIQVFIGFANFYQFFIQGFSKKTALLISILKTTGLSKQSDLRVFKAGNNEVVGNGDRANKTVVDLSKSKNKKSRKLMRMPNIKVTGEPNFLTPNTKKAFNHLRLAFIKAPILQHFDLESHIRIETDILGYAIGKVLSQWNLDSNATLNNLNLDKSDFSQ